MKHRTWILSDGSRQLAALCLSLDALESAAGRLGVVSLRPQITQAEQGVVSNTMISKLVEELSSPSLCRFSITGLYSIWLG